MIDVSIFYPFSSTTAFITIPAVTDTHPLFTRSCDMTLIISRSTRACLRRNHTNPSCDDAAYPCTDQLSFDASFAPHAGEPNGNEADFATTPPAMQSSVIIVEPDAEFLDIAAYHGEGRKQSGVNMHRMDISDKYSLYNIKCRRSVIVVDDDGLTTEYMAELFRSVNLETISHNSPRSFWSTGLPNGPCCLVIDVRLPEESGIEIKRKLNAKGLYIPTVFISGYADITSCTQAMKLGAIDFLEKPFRNQDLLDAVWEALRIDGERIRCQRKTDDLRRLAAALTPREIEVLQFVGKGLLSKQIAYALGIAEITVKTHRSSAFKKLKGTGAADMIQKIRALGLLDHDVRSHRQIGIQSRHLADQVNDEPAWP